MIITKTRFFRYAPSRKTSLAILLTLCACLNTWSTAAGAQEPAEAKKPITAQELRELRDRDHRTEILWDKFGVPHIYGKDVPAVLRGFGCAQMENHAELLLQLVAAARGRSAEYFGPGESNQNVTSDIFVRTNEIPQRALQWYATGGDEQRRFIDAFVRGINQYAATHRASIAPQFLRVLPVVPADVLAVGQKTFQFTFMASESDAFELVQAWQEGPIPDPEGPIPSPQSSARSLAEPPNGSNGWALAPRRTRSGNAILLSNPHLPWGMNQAQRPTGALQWFEAQLVTGMVNVQGVAFVGMPFMAMGFTDDLGWTHVANSLKNVDLYQLTLVNNGYLYEGQVRPLLRKQDQIRILQSNGTLQTQSFDVLSSIHGPIIARRDDKALAIRVAGLKARAAVTQYWDMARARNLQEFNQAYKRLQMPYFNLLYADRHGDIMYLYGGHQPVRSGGEYSDWRGILPGDKASALWTRVLSWDELPKVINPAGGFVQNCNNPPWTSTFPQEIFAENYPAYISPLEMSLRAQHSARFLLSKESFTLMNCSPARCPHAWRSLRACCPT